MSVPADSPRALYEAMVRFAQENGLRREELGSGWWYGEKVQEEVGLGEAVELLLRDHHDIDVRDAVPDEVEEFWG